MKIILFCYGFVFFLLTEEILTAFEPDVIMIAKMSQVNNITQWCELMNLPDCEQVIEDTSPDDGVDETGEKMVVSGSEKAEIALFDACNPREQTIALPRHPDPDITTWPPCTRALRCGGCCTSDVFSCEPTSTNERFVKVFDTRLPYPGAHRFKFIGIRLVKVIEHVHCDAQCKTKEHECHKYQYYDARRCRCICRPERESIKKTCIHDQIWDENDCDCICPNRNTLVCPDPSYFNSATCRCTLKMGVTGEIDLDKLFEQLMKENKADIILNGGVDEVLGTNVIAGNITMEEVESDGGDKVDDKEGGNNGVNGVDEKEGGNNDVNGADDKNGGKNGVNGVDEKNGENNGVGDKEGGNNNEGNDGEGDNGENATLSQISSSTSTSTSTTTTPTTTTTTTEKTTTAKPTTPAPTQDPCAGKTCWGNWKVVYIPKTGICQCVPNIG